MNFASLKYKQLPPFCSHCGIVGHTLETCRAVAGWSTKQDKPKAPKVHNAPTPEAWIRKDNLT